MKRRVSEIAVMILSFLVLLALSAETALKPCGVNSGS